MASTAESYLRALQALSGDADLNAARKALLSGIDDKDVLAVALHVVSTMLPRCHQEELIQFALDNTAKLQQHATLSSPRPAVVRDTTIAQRTRMSLFTHWQTVQTPPWRPALQVPIPNMISPATRAVSSAGPLMPSHPQMQCMPPTSMSKRGLPGTTAPAQDMSPLRYVSPYQPVGPADISHKAKRAKVRVSCPKKDATATPTQCIPPKHDLPAPGDERRPIELDSKTASVPASALADREIGQALPDSGDNMIVDAIDHSTANPIASSPFAVVPNIELYLRKVSFSGTNIDPTTSCCRVRDKQTVLSEALRGQFHTYLGTTQEYKDRYYSIVADLDVYLGDYQCLELRIQTAQRQKSCTYYMSEHRKDYACDWCISRRRLCVKLGKVHGRTQLMGHPLPLKLRGGTKWQDVSYWVQS